MTQLPGGYLQAIFAAAGCALTLPAALVLASLPGAGLDGGRIVRALAWARSGDLTRAGRAAQLGGLHPGQPHLGQRARGTAPTG